MALEMSPQQGATEYELVSGLTPVKQAIMTRAGLISLVETSKGAQEIRLYPL